MRAKDRRMEEDRKAAREKAEQERLAAIAREKHLDSVAGRVPELRRLVCLVVTLVLLNTY